MGVHLAKRWCRRQPVIALSFGEAELYSSVCGLACMLGVVRDAWSRLEMLFGTCVHRMQVHAAADTGLEVGGGGVGFGREESLPSFLLPSPPFTPKKLKLVWGLGEGQSD